MLKFSIFFINFLKLLNFKNFSKNIKIKYIYKI